MPVQTPPPGGPKALRQAVLLTLAILALGCVLVLVIISLRGSHPESEHLSELGKYLDQYQQRRH